ncbi:heme transporter hrg1-B-like [Anoplophora glabripennis]|uniref:heme transporter hrg1-B-like n=1 Tax=Anoplophora glabripennis TaxID=217634 RepID=UPI00087486E5|nr:heme transporter hrg1-B-like [Anoplophora glabripennis]
MTTIRLIHSGICAFFGYSAFFAFIVLKNYPSAVLGLISGFTDSILFFLHYLLRKRTLREWYGPTDLRTMCRYGILIATVGLLSLGYHTTIQIIYKKSILPIPDSSVISIVWSIVALRSGLFLMYYSIKYQHIDDVRLLTNVDEETNNAENSPEQEEAVQESDNN